MRRLEDENLKHIDVLIKRYPELAAIRSQLEEAYRMMEECYRHHKKILIAGNGGSACDAEHIVGELMKQFKIPRELEASEKSRLMEIDSVRGKILSEKLQKPLPAIALVSQIGFNTAFSNDVDASLCFAQQIKAYGNEGDIFLGITTSGNSENIIYAAVTAKAVGMKVIGFTGNNGGNIKEMADIMVRMPEEETSRVQELQMPVYHCWCQMLEEAIFG